MNDSNGCAVFVVVIIIVIIIIFAVAGGISSKKEAEAKIAVAQAQIATAEAESRRLDAAKRAEEEQQRIEKEKKRIEEERERARLEAERRARVEIRQKEIMTFVQENAADLFTAINNVEYMDKAVNNRLIKLRQVLIDMGRTPEEDPDLMDWLNRHNEVRETRSVLQKQMEDTYLAYMKFKLSPDVEARRAEYMSAMETGNATAKQVQQLYVELKQKLENPK